MTLITKQHFERLTQNGRENAVRISKDGQTIDHFPVVKLFTPDGSATWLLSEIDPGDNDLAFGLCDLGLGSPELGFVRLSDIASLRGRLGLPVERDRHFVAVGRLSAYAAIARAEGRIVA